MKTTYYLWQNQSVFDITNHKNKLMKKLLLSIAFILVASITMAQRVVTAIDTQKEYTLECRSGVAHNTARFIGVDADGVINGQSSTAAAIKFEAAGAENGYYIKVGEKYLNHNGTNISASTEKSTVWTFGVGGKENVANVVTFTIGNDKYLNNNGSDCADGTCKNLKANPHAGGPAAINACSLWEMREKIPTFKITYQYILNGNVVATQNEEVAPGGDYPDFNVPNIRLGIVPTTAKPEGQVDGEETIDIALAIDNSLIPFEFVENGTPKTWYYAQIHSNNKKYIIPNNEGQLTWSVTELPEDEADADNYTWGFVGNVIDGFVMVNRAGKAVVAGDIATIGDEGTAYIAMPTSENVEGGFCLLNGESYMNAQDDFVKEWGDNDAGSTIVLTKRELPENPEPENPTAVENVEAENENVEIYDLTGRKVENITKAGIYVVNGCKVLIK